MGVLSVLNNFRLAPKKFVIISLILGIFLILPSETQSASSQADKDETIHLEKLPFCDDSIIRNRESSKRYIPKLFQGCAFIMNFIIHILLKNRLYWVLFTSCH